MASPEQPFDDRELRYFLAEILKVSSIHPYELFNLIQSRGITPNWNDIALPNGRSVSACTKAYNSLFQTPPTMATAVAPYQPLSSYEQPTPAPKTKKKRPHPSEGPPILTEGSPITIDRTLQPQLPNFPSVNAPSDPATFQPAPGAITGEPPRKKRGRPSKEEFDKRVAEAARRGEVYPQPRKRKTPRASAEGVAGSIMVSPGTVELSARGEGSTGRKRATQAMAGPAESNPNPGFAERQMPLNPSDRNPDLEATASAADSMQIDTEEAVPSTIPETQASSFPAQESLLAGMREHAARDAPETAQSSYTLKEESAPRSEMGPPSATVNKTTTTPTTT